MPTEEGEMQMGTWDPVDCPFCNSNFAHKWSLLKHVKRKHEDRFKDFRGTVCGNKQYKKSLEEKCPYCEERFSSETNIWKHVRVDHSEKLEEYEKKTKLCP